MLRSTRWRRGGLESDCIGRVTSWCHGPGRGSAAGPTVVICSDDRTSLPKGPEAATGDDRLPRLPPLGIPDATGSSTSRSRFVPASIAPKREHPFVQLDPPEEHPAARRLLIKGDLAPLLQFPDSFRT